MHTFDSTLANPTKPDPQGKGGLEPTEIPDLQSYPLGNDTAPRPLLLLRVDNPGGK